MTECTHPIRGDDAIVAAGIAAVRRDETRVPALPSARDGSVVLVRAGSGSHPPRVVPAVRLLGGGASMTTGSASADPAARGGADVGITIAVAGVVRDAVAALAGWGPLRLG